MTIHCRVIAFLSADTSRDFVSLTFDVCPFDFEQLTHMADHVNNPATKFEDPTPTRSWVLSYNVPLWLPLYAATAYALNQVTRELGVRIVKFLECQIPICIFTIHLLLAQTTIKGRLVVYLESRAPGIPVQHLWGICHEQRY